MVIGEIRIRSRKGSVLLCASREFLGVRSGVLFEAIRARGGDVRDGRETHARRGEARALRALLARFPGHLGLVVFPSRARPLPLGGLARWRLVSCRLDDSSPRLPFPPGVFDAVLLVHALGEGAAPPAVLAEALRVLAAAGRLVTVLRHPLAPGRPRPLSLPVTRLLRAQGLRIESRVVLRTSPFRRLPSLRIRPLDRIVVAHRPPPLSGLLLPGLVSRRRLPGSVPQGSRFQP